MGMITAVLLAAGESRRWGSENKLLAEIGGEPMVRRTARTLCASRADRVIAVLGHEAEAVKAALDGLSVETVFNSGYAEGQVTSVRTGLWAADRKPLGIMICLADQPLLTSALYNGLIDCFFDHQSRIVIPVLDGDRANPIILPAAFRSDILAGGVNVGCRKFIDRHPDLVKQVTVTDPAFGQDFDTPDALADWIGSGLRRSS